MKTKNKTRTRAATCVIECSQALKPATIDIITESVREWLSTIGTDSDAAYVGTTPHGQPLALKSGHLKDFNYVRLVWV